MGNTIKPYWQSADGMITVYHAPFDDTAVARLPEAPIAIVERVKTFQRSTRATRKDEPIGPLFGGQPGMVLQPVPGAS